ncbi:hypothetical protein Dvina_37460 [Dactylosporangium vinaceum]|uniref:Uncharacterized protein n=1 Tax=Dactylosporangium vinaceum TaxID=53362 RepID=A0ABV5MQV7_9ACTN|nr:hypothetical protein [Dactylosporangium vinaceum]UAB93851.1 hypothetical protein Dvina_37460 [Dactylosporangium vinaceum]
MRRDWRCATCATPWPCAIGQANLTATVHAGNGPGVGLALASAIGRAWLDQPDACPGCLIGQFLHWISDDLYAMIATEPGAPTATPTAHDNLRTRPSPRTRTPAQHLPDCPYPPPAADRHDVADQTMPAGAVPT